MAEIVVKLVNGELAGKTAQEIKKEVSAAALALNKAKIGTEEWVKANKRMDEVKQTQSDLKKQIEGTTSASDMLKKAWNGLPGASFFNQIGQSFGMAKQGVGGLVSSMGVLKGAIAATGIGALVLVIASLVSWFAKTDEGATKLDGIMRAIGNTIDVLLNRLINLKQTLLTLFTNPGQFFKGLVSDIKEGIELGQELAETFDELDQKRRDMELVDAGQSNQINQLLLQSKNVSLSYAERLAILEEVDKLEQENYQTKLAYSQEFSAAVDKETNQMIKSGTITDEQLDKQNDARIKLLAVQGESIVLQEKIENRRSQLLEKQQAEREKDIAKKEKENQEFLKAQEKFNEEQNKLAEKQELYVENRRIASMNREAERIKASMVLAAKQLDDKVKGIELEQAERQKLNDAIAQMEQAKLAVFNEGTSAVIGLLASDEAARKKNANAIKFFESGRVAVNGVAEISEIAKTFAALGPVGQILAAFRIAFSAARTVTGIRRINATKFALGGAVQGPRHSGGGVPIEAEGGEFIMSRKTVSAIGVGALSAMNNHYTKFANGGSVPMPSSPYRDRAPVASGRAGSSAGGDGLGINELRSDLRAYTSAINDRIDRIQVVNNLQDTQKGLTTLNQLKNEADV